MSPNICQPHQHKPPMHSVNPWLIRHFPHVQFLDGTHSLVVCQAAAKQEQLC